MEEQVSLFAQDLWYGKMSQGHSQAEAPKEQTSLRSSKRSSKSQSRTPMCVCVYRKTDGQNPGASTLQTEDGALLGEYTMHSFGESPKEENASHLSQILVDSPHPKYCLSEKACQGILNRAEKRGKELPDLLKKALLEQVTRSKLGGGREVDSHGNKAGKGALIQTELSGTLGVSQDQTLFSRCPVKGGAVISFDPGAHRYLGKTFENVNKTIAQGTAPGFHDAIAYDERAAEDRS